MWPKKPKKNPLSPSKKKPKMEDVLGEITRPSTKSSSLKIGSPTIRVGLNAAKGSPKQPKAITIPQEKVGKLIGPKPNSN